MTCEQLRAQLAIQTGELQSVQTQYSQVTGQIAIDQITLNVLLTQPQTPQIIMQEQQLQTQIDANKAIQAVLAGEVTAAQTAVTLTQTQMQIQGCQ